MNDAVARATEILSTAHQVTVLTGAGISTDSGIPDFRGPDGVWTRNPDAERRSDISFYLSDPEVRKRAWQNRLGRTALRAEPNQGHLALVELERQGRLHTLITQNVDGLHHRAGSSAERVIEIHGTMREVMCMSCGDRQPIEHALERVGAGEEDPACIVCGGILKAATVSFGQSLDGRALERAERAAVECDVMLAVGTSLTVYPIADVVPMAKQCGAAVVIVNAEPTPFDRMADAVVQASISEVLPQLLAGS